MQPCIRCAKCVSACPMGLAPNVLAKAATYQNWECAGRRTRSWTVSNVAHAASPARPTARCSTSYAKEKPKSAPSFAAATPNNHSRKPSIMNQTFIVSPSPHVHSGNSIPKCMYDVLDSLDTGLPGVAIFLWRRRLGSDPHVGCGVRTF